MIQILFRILYTYILVTLKLFNIFSVNVILCITNIYSGSSSEIEGRNMRVLDENIISKIQLNIKLIMKSK